MMPASPSLFSLYFSKNSSAPEKAIWVMYRSTSSSVMPMPLSETISCFLSGSMVTMTLG